MTDGDQIVTPSENYVLTQVTIKKPLTLISENIAKDVNIAGIVGTFEGGSSKTETTKTIDSLDFSSGSIVIEPDDPVTETLSQVTITKPATLIAGNIIEGATIAGIDGTFKMFVATTNSQMNGFKNSNYVGSVVRYDGSGTTYENGRLYYVTDTPTLSFVKLYKEAEIGSTIDLTACESLTSLQGSNNFAGTSTVTVKNTNYHFPSLNSISGNENFAYSENCNYFFYNTSTPPMLNTPSGHSAWANSTGYKIFVKYSVGGEYIENNDWLSFSSSIYGFWDATYSGGFPELIASESGKRYSLTWYSDVNLATIAS